jgi:phage baseplate assembly protein V
MEKNLLSDTDYTRGWDNRFGAAVVVGKVTKIECNDKQANVRVIFPDRLDHQDQPLISKPVPVMQVASTAKKSFTMPRLNTNVVCVKLPNSTSNYVVIGSFYTSKDPPPVTDPMLDYIEYDDGSTMQFDANTGKLTWKLKGDILLDNEKDFTIKQKGDFNVETDGNVAVTPKGDLDITATGDVVIQGGTLKLQGPLTIEGDITHTGDMVTSGHHTDAAGHHTTSTRESELLQRIEALEARVAALENRTPLEGLA